MTFELFIFCQTSTQSNSKRVSCSIISVTKRLFKTNLKEDDIEFKENCFYQNIVLVLIKLLFVCFVPFSIFLCNQGRLVYLYLTLHLSILINAGLWLSFLPWESVVVPSHSWIFGLEKPVPFTGLSVLWLSCDQWHAQRHVRTLTLVLRRYTLSKERKLFWNFWRWQLFLFTLSKHISWILLIIN